MDNQIAVVEWSTDGSRAYNPATRQTASAPTLAEALKKVGSPQTVGLCLGRRVTFVRETHVPDIEKSELRMIVELQLDSLFPAMGTELAFDYQKGTYRYDDGIQTLVAAAPAELLRKAIEEAEEAGVGVAWVAPVAAGAPGVARAEGHDDAIVVEAADGFLSLDVVRHGLLVYSRAAIDPKGVEGRQGEVTRTLASYGLSSAAVLAVEGTDLGADVRTCPRGALQALADPGAHRLNVELPEAVAKKSRHAGQVKARLATFLWLAVVCVGALVYFDRSDMASAISGAQTDAARNQSDAKKDLELVTGRLTTAETSLKSLNLAFEPAQSVSEVLTLVSNAVPSTAWLTGVTYERGKDIQIRGTALDGNAVTVFTSELAINSRFRNVKLVFANNSEIEGTPVVQFAITAHVVGNLPLVEKKKGAKR